jgi:hypothetical protein
MTLVKSESAQLIQTTRLGEGMPFLGAIFKGVGTTETTSHKLFKDVIPVFVADGIVCVSVVMFCATSGTALAGVTGLVTLAASAVYMANSIGFCALRKRQEYEQDLADFNQPQLPAAAPLPEPPIGQSCWDCLHQSQGMCANDGQPTDAEQWCPAWNNTIDITPTTFAPAPYIPDPALTQRPEPTLAPPSATRAQAVSPIGRDEEIHLASLWNPEPEKLSDDTAQIHEALQGAVAETGAGFTVPLDMAMQESGRSEDNVLAIFAELGGKRSKQYLFNVSAKTLKVLDAKKS